MKSFKLEPINLQEDKPQIEAWAKKYHATPEYEAIRHFILEDDLIYGLGELIATNYEHFSIGKKEVKKMLIARTAQNEIIGFVIFDVFDIDTNHPEMFFQYIVINPKFQHAGYGTELLTELFGNIKKYAEVTPQSVFCNIHKDNSASRKLFSNFGFEFDEVENFEYARAITSNKSLQEVIASKKEKI